MRHWNIQFDAVGMAVRQLGVMGLKGWLEVVAGGRARVTSFTFYNGTFFALEQNEGTHSITKT